MAIAKAQIHKTVSGVQTRFPLEYYGRADLFRRGRVSKSAQGVYQLDLPPNYKGFECGQPSEAVAVALEQQKVSVERRQIIAPIVDIDLAALGFPAPIPFAHIFVYVPEQHLAIGLTPWDQLFGIYPHQEIDPNHPVLKDSLTLPYISDIHVPNLLGGGLNIGNIYRNETLFRAFLMLSSYGSDASYFAIHTVRYNVKLEGSVEMLSTRVLCLACVFNPGQHATLIENEEALPFFQAMERLGAAEQTANPTQTGEDRAICTQLIESAWPSVQSFLQNLCALENRHH